ncbi:MAG: Mpo1 family 2-hydroxy fatty acid dioxygenase [Myxococcaceae bacterium]
MNPKLISLFEDYSDGHRHPTNRLTHKIAIPLIVFHIIEMLYWVKLFTLSSPALTITLAHVVAVFAMIWYLRMSVKLALVLGVGFAACFPLGWITPRWAVVVIALVGWLVQLAGHVVWEKKQPAFLKNLVHALVGPLFFIAVLLGDWPAAQVRTAQTARG